MRKGEGEERREGGRVSEGRERQGVEERERQGGERVQGEKRQEAGKQTRKEEEREGRDVARGAMSLKRVQSKGRLTQAALSC
jgi:hypothetical protein